MAASVCYQIVKRNYFLTLLFAQCSFERLRSGGSQMG